MHIRILDKYIFREVVLTFVFGICAFSAVFIGSGTLFRIAEYITDYGASLASVVKIFVYGLPGIIIWTFPMSMLLAVLLTFGRLSSSSEITAMKSCGIGFSRIAAPAILLGCIVSVCAIAFNEYVVPWANTSYNNVLNYEIRGNVEMKSQEHLIFKEIHEGRIQKLIYARDYVSETETMHGVTLQEYDAEGRVAHVENAEYAEWRNETWTLYNGIIYDVTDQQTMHTMHFRSQTLPISAGPRQIVRAQKRLDEMTMKELKEQIRIMQTQFVNTNEIETELYQRITVPMASLIFALIGIPLAAHAEQLIHGLCDERYHHFLVLRGNDHGECLGARRSRDADSGGLDSEHHWTGRGDGADAPCVPLILEGMDYVWRLFDCGACGDGRRDCIHR